MLNRRLLPRLLLAALALGLLLALSVSAADERQARFIVLMIGDGMGAAQRAAAELYAQALSGEARRLTMNALPVNGSVATRAHDAAVTDSAAAATAMACGQKTCRGMVSMGPDGETRLKTIAEIARERGMKVGIVSTSCIDDATPACFYAHASSRKEQDIAMQLAQSGFEFFGGGGARKGQSEAGKDRASPVDVAREGGYTVVTGRQGLEALRAGAAKVWAIGNAADGDGALPHEMDRAPDHPSLADFTRKALELLDGPDGFFLMVEGGAIDPACHANDAAAAIHDVLALDRAVAEAVAFQRRRPDDTLVIVVADHETGGMSLDPAAETGLLLKAIQGQRMSGFRFADRIEVFRVERVSFLKAMAEIREAFGLEDPSAGETAQLEAAFAASMARVKGDSPNKAERRLYGSREPLAVTCTRLVSRRAGIAWAGTSHTAASVPVSAVGVGQERFAGEMDNTDIFHRTLSVMARPAVEAAAGR